MVRQLWSVNSLSVELNVDRRTLSKKLSDLPPDGEGIEAGKAVRRWYMARVLKHLRGSGAKQVLDVRAERARLTRAQAKKTEMEVDAIARKLLPFDEVVSAWEQLVAAFRARCLAMPSKLAPQLAATNERREVQDALTAAVREALQELSRFDLPRDRPGRGEPPPGSNGKSRPRRARATPVH